MRTKQITTQQKTWVVEKKMRLIHKLVNFLMIM
jgi:hypothetical protein